MTKPPRLKSGRGGQRSNAGRPSAGPRKTITVRITEPALDWLNEQPESQSIVVDRLIKEKASVNPKEMEE